MNVGALLISISKSTDKITALLKMGDIPAITRMVLTFKMAGVDRVYIATNQDEHLKKEVSKLGVTFLETDPENIQMFDYIKAALVFLEPLEDYLFVAPASVPLFKVETVEALMKEPKPLLVPTWENKSGHPLLLSTKLVPKLMAYTGKGGLNRAIPHLGLNPEFLPVNDSGILIHDKKDQDYKEALISHSLTFIHPEVRVRLCREKPFLGPGMRQLLTLVDTTGSLRVACNYMGISYSKGRSMVRLAEQQLKYPLLTRKQGGEFGGSSILTPKGAQLLKQYIGFEKEVKEASNLLFQKYFK